MPKAPTTIYQRVGRFRIPLAPRDSSGLINRTQARKDYRLTTSDLDSIRPVNVKRCGHFLRQEYNISDVKALDVRLNSAVPDPSERTPENGPQIHKWDVYVEFKPLQPLQLARIKPVSEIPHPEADEGKPPIPIYNRCDVEALHASVQEGAALTDDYAELVYPSRSSDWVPPTRRSAGSSATERAKDSSPDVDWGITAFEGLDSDHAAKLAIFLVTGIRL
ncbi:hypothetical protein C8R43DRAFT_986234 [Mycena crocata]|nr:hypothetical protein C8R43DRAFT_986234 [Mycena crocata]